MLWTAVHIDDNEVITHVSSSKNYKLVNDDASWNKESVIGRLFGTDNRCASILHQAVASTRTFYCHLHFALHVELAVGCNSDVVETCAEFFILEALPAFIYLISKLYAKYGRQCLKTNTPRIQKKNNAKNEKWRTMRMLTKDAICGACNADVWCVCVRLAAVGWGRRIEATRG